MITEECNMTLKLDAMLIVLKTEEGAKETIQFQYLEKAQKRIDLLVSRGISALLTP